MVHHNKFCTFSFFPSSLKLEAAHDPQNPALPALFLSAVRFGLFHPDPVRGLARAVGLSGRLRIRQRLLLRKGVYLAGTGPSYETPSEYRYFRLIGADAVGMSTIPEVIVARHCGIPVFGMSVITNEAHDDYAEDYVNDGDAVVKAADAAADRMSEIFTRMIASLQ